MAVGFPTGGPNRCSTKYIMFIHYGIAGKEISFLDFLALPVGILHPGYPSPVLSKRRQGIACGVACSIAERAV